ncbi:MAG: hypothetical protein K8W52_17930 [Deltaproteobacteria bacterium]|nr:hypothetical protein [Deltaproteobacteria bacterium]
MSACIAARRPRVTLAARTLLLAALALAGCKAESRGKAPVALPSTAVALTSAAPLAVGRAVFVDWNGDWFEATVLADAADGTVKIHYVGWEDRWDEAVPRARVRITP